MSSWESYRNDPHWNAMARYALGDSNNGFYKKFNQGTVGMNSPMNLYSNEYSYLSMKHGSNSAYPYSGGVRDFMPGMMARFPNLTEEVKECSHQTFDPVGCQMKAITTVINSQNMPYDISRLTGAHKNMQVMQPNGSGY